MELQVGVKVLLKNPEGKYLLIRRSDDKYQSVTNKWDIPGGRINAGATLLDNLAREVMEETGLVMNSASRIIGAQDIFDTANDRHIVRVTYVGTADGEPHLSEEHTDYQWATLEEMRALPNLDKYLKTLLESDITGI